MQGCKDGKLQDRYSITQSRRLIMKQTTVPRTHHNSIFYFTIIAWTVALSINLTHAMPSPRGHMTVMNPELEAGETTVNIPGGFRIFGDAQFTTVHINAVGAVSFGGIITTSNLSSVRNRVIVFAPLLLMPRNHGTGELPDLTIRYTTEVSGEDLTKLQDDFRENMTDPTIVVDKVLIVSVEDHEGPNEEGNSYEIIIVGDRERTYVRYEYKRVVRIQDQHGYASAGIFSFSGMEGSIFCSEELPESRTPAIANLNTPTSTFKHWRVDLPLECVTFDSDCGDLLPDAAIGISATQNGYFMETHTEVVWSFYALHVCLRHYIRSDGTTMVRQGCVYDPDYYTYSWMDLTPLDRCHIFDA